MRFFVRVGTLPGRRKGSVRTGAGRRRGRGGLRPGGERSRCRPKRPGQKRDGMQKRNPGSWQGPYVEESEGRVRGSREEEGGEKRCSAWSVRKKAGIWVMVGIQRKGGVSQIAARATRIRAPFGGRIACPPYGQSVVPVEMSKKCAWILTNREFSVCIFA